MLHAPAGAPVDFHGLTDFMLDWVDHHDLPRPDRLTPKAHGLVGKKMFKFDDGYKRLCSHEFQDISSLQLDSDAPAAEGDFEDWQWLSLVDTDGTLFFGIEQASIGGEIWSEFAASARQYYPFQYGYTYEMEYRTGPVFYAVGMLYGPRGRYYSKIQEEAISKWMHARIEAKKQGVAISDFLRDVYETNFLSDTHLALPLQDGTLHDWISANYRNGLLESFGDRLYVWRVAPRYVDYVRTVLGRARLLVSWGGSDTPSGGITGAWYGPGNPRMRPDTTLPGNPRPWDNEDTQWFYLNNTKHLARLMERYGFSGKRRSFSLPLLEKIFAAWLIDQEKNKATETEISNILGAAFGKILTEKLGMEWVTLTDQVELERATIHRATKTMAYPVSSIRKRIETQEVGFFDPVFQAVKESIEKTGK